MKKYSASVDYEKKLKTIMDKLGVEKYNYDWTRKDCYIEFFYKGQLYRFEHSIEKAAKSGEKISYVSDCFAQLVLTLEDIARMTARNIYELSAWIEGMKTLPKPKDIPQCFLLLGFTDIPDDVSEIKSAYRSLAKIYHPDIGGNKEDFEKYTKAKDDCLEFISRSEQE